MRKLRTFQKVPKAFLFSQLKSPFLYTSSSSFFSSTSSLYSLDNDLKTASSKIQYDSKNRIDLTKTSAELLKSPDLLKRLTSGLSENRAKPLRVTVTGAAGAIGYALLFRIASGDVFGPNCPIILQCLEIPQGMKALEGVKMELQDAAFPTLKEIKTFDDQDKAFEGADIAFLVGAQPRTKGMDRADLLKKNAAIFSAQGKSINKVANRDTFLGLVVGNPANTNCLIAALNAPDIPRTRFSAMTKLDHNRGLAQLAEKLNCNVDQIKNFCIFGNHSDTQYPFIDLAKLRDKNGQEKSIKDIINDEKWVDEVFIPTVAKRGAAIIAARGASSAASAASSAIDHVRDWLIGTDDWTSMAVWSGDKEGSTPYGVSPGIYYSFPVICNGLGKYKIVDDIPVLPHMKKRMQNTNDELLKEKEAIKELGLI